MLYIHFEIETVKSNLTLVTPNCYMTKGDINDTYYSVPILVEHQKYLKFYFRGKLYQFTYLPNGICSGPHQFTKLLKPPPSNLRLPQVNVAGFTTAKGTYCTFFDSLGFVSPKKTNICPS